MMKFSRRFGMVAVLCTSALALAVGMPAKAAEKKTIGLALTGFHIEMPDRADECPDGFQFNSVDNFKAMYPDEKARDNVGKLLPDSGSQSMGAPEHRGPNAESISFRPWIIKDPLPFREVQSKIAFGKNLDGTTDGRATDKTCKHQKFTSVDGTATDIDNELFRVTACWRGMRKGGHPREFFDSQNLVANPNNRFLIEISDVDDELNDDHVDVTFYKGMDKIVRDAKGEPYPGLSQRVDRRDPDYTQHTTGKIINGELITDTMPKFVRPFIHAQFAVGEFETLDMQLRLKLDSTQAQGLMTGYYDISKWYFLHAKTARIGVGNWSPSSMWEALVRRADGYKDPKTGQCSAISSAYGIQAVRTHIIKDEQPARTAETNSKEFKAAQNSR